MRRRLDENRAISDADGRAKLHADIAHPINSACREMIQDRVIEALRGGARAIQRAGLPLHLRRLRRRPLRHAAGTVRGRIPALRVVRTEETSHRIEPAAAQTVPPSHNVPANTRFNAVAQHSTRGMARAESEEDFGAGIDSVIPAFHAS